MTDNANQIRVVIVDPAQGARSASTGSGNDRERRPTIGTLTERTAAMSGERGAHDERSAAGAQPLSEHGPVSARPAHDERSGERSGRSVSAAAERPPSGSGPVTITIPLTPPPSVPAAPAEDRSLANGSEWVDIAPGSAPVAASVQAPPTVPASPAAAEPQWEPVTPPTAVRAAVERRRPSSAPVVVGASTVAAVAGAGFAVGLSGQSWPLLVVVYAGIGAVLVLGARRVVIRVLTWVQERGR